MGTFAIGLVVQDTQIADMTVIVSVEIRFVLLGQQNDMMAAARTAAIA